MEAKAAGGSMNLDDFATGRKPGMLGLYAIRYRLAGYDELHDGSRWADSEDAARAAFAGQAGYIEIVEIRRLRWRDVLVKKTA